MTTHSRCRIRPFRLCQTRRVEPRQIKYWPKPGGGATAGLAHEGRRCGVQAGGCGAACSACHLPLVLAGSPCRQPSRCAGCRAEGAQWWFPGWQRGARRCQSAVRLLGWISGLIRARLRARRGASTLPTACPTWALPTALPRLLPGTSVLRDGTAWHRAAETHLRARPRHSSAAAAGSAMALSCLIRGRCSRAGRAGACRALHPQQGPCPAIPAGGSRSLFSYK